METNATPGRVNLALNRAAYQSSSADDDHTGHLATDGSTRTWWESEAGGEQWLAVDLGEVGPVDEVTLRWGDAFAIAYRIDVSTDGRPPANWLTVFETLAARGGVEKIGFPAVLARHVRMIATQCAGGRGCALAEFEVRGAPRPPRPRLPQPAPRPGGSLLLTGGNWRLQNALFVDAPPARIARTDFDDTDWIPAVVPGTVLTSYLAAGAIPDPRFGDQQSQISEAFFTHNDFWYRDTFEVPVGCAGRRLWLNFDGINWKAEIFFNGAAVGRIDGAFIRGRFDVTAWAQPGAVNCLAALVHRVAHPGTPRHKRLHQQYPNGGELGLDSPTFVSSIGWNWLPTIRGRNIGIWNDVRLETTGDVTLVDPWVTTDLPLPDTTRADLTIQVEVRNHAATPQRGVLVGRIGDRGFRHPVSLKPAELRHVVLDKADCPALAFDGPDLWWPNGYGAQPLYTLQLQFEQAGVVSDRQEVNFGIRAVECRAVDGQLVIFVNGRRILCRGGNWGMEEGMLDCDRAGYDLRVRLHRDLNLVMIRNWVGMVGREAFYDACDRHGLLIWDDFWLANPVDGPDPADPAMFLANVRDKIRRVRSHPSLALYCGRNEGRPPPDLDAGMRAAVAELDGTRHYLPDSAAGTVTGFGPYEVQDPEWYFANRGATLHSELGIVSVPPVESMRAMLPADRLWPINDLWAVHDYQTPRVPRYTERIARRYGAPADLEDYCRKAQMVNLETAKAMYECLQSRQGGGLLVWMTQPAWPSLICQLYDYAFEPTAAFFGAKKACEPLHILWDSHANRVKVANNTLTDRPDLTAEAWIHDLAGRPCAHQSVALVVPSTSVRECFAFGRPAGLTSVFFVRLRLKQADVVVSDNFYWSSGAGESCRDLEKLPAVPVTALATGSVESSTWRLTVALSNPTGSVALMIRLKVARARSGERVLPVFYDDNYVSLLPGEQRTVGVSFDVAALAGEAPRLIAEGWNIPPQEIPIG